MKTGKEKSEIRRKRAAEAIAALGIPGVATTRNLEAWLIERKSCAIDVGLFYVQPGRVIAACVPSATYECVQPADTMRAIDAPAEDPFHCPMCGVSVHARDTNCLLAGTE